jgi:hypothetical protein
MSNLDNDISHLSAAQQTRLSWTKFIATYDQLPPAYQKAYDELFTVGGKFPYTLWTPGYADLLKPVPERLICTSEESIIIFEKRGEKIRHVSMKYDSISYIENGIVLLHSWLTIFGIDQNGEIAAPSIRYNTVSEEMVLPILASLRVSPDRQRVSPLDVEMARFDYLSKINFKFMNYGRSSIRNGDQVLKIVLQPEIREEIVRIFGISFSKQVSPDHIVILTKDEIISIRNTGKVSSYGGIWNYIPREKISSVSLENDDNGWLILGLQLQSGHRVLLTFDESRKTEIEKFRDEIRTDLTGPVVLQAG